MSEFRQDSTTGAWVLIAPERARRTRQDRAPERRPIPAFDPACPFCPGNENLLPEIVSEVAAAAAPGWQVRVAPNKYPAVREDVSSETGAADARTIEGHGTHRVIIESPRHDADFDTLTGEGLNSVLGVYRAQFAELADRSGTESVILFRNRGVAAGASLPHPHAQIISLPMRPPQIVLSEHWARDHYDRHERCAACSMIQSELEDGRRIVEATAHFAAFVPFAAACPFEIHVYPVRHVPCFAQAAERELADLATLLRRVLRRLKHTIGDAPSNWVLDSAVAREQESPFLHWRLRIRPALAVWGGFELGAGIPINPSLPEKDAGALRSAAP